MSLDSLRVVIESASEPGYPEGCASRTGSNLELVLKLQH